MPAIEVWGPAVWTLFHTLAERVHENAYPFISNQLFLQIVRICKVLPCPDCSTDASIFLAKINISTIKTKTEFKNFVYLIHNYVNVKKHKPLFNVINLNRYSNYKLIPVVNNFLNNFNTKGNMNLINDSFQRTLVLNNFKKWFSANIHAFTQPPRLQTPLKELEEPVKNIVENLAQNVEEVVNVEQHIATNDVEEEPVTNVEEEPLTNVEEEVANVEEEPVTNVEEPIVSNDVEEEPVTNVEEEPVTNVEEEVANVEEEPVSNDVEEDIVSNDVEEDIETNDVEEDIVSNDVEEDIVSNDVEEDIETNDVEEDIETNDVV